MVLLLSANCKAIFNEATVALFSQVTSVPLPKSPAADRFPPGSRHDKRYLLSGSSVFGRGGIQHWQSMLLSEVGYTHGIVCPRQFFKYQHFLLRLMNCN